MNKGKKLMATGMTVLGVWLTAAGAVMAHPDEEALVQSLAPGSQGVQKEGIVSSENVNLNIEVRKGEKDGKGEATLHVWASAGPTGGLGCGSLDETVRCSFEIGSPTGEMILGKIERLEWTAIVCATSTDLGGWKWDEKSRRHLCFPEGKELVWPIAGRDKDMVFVVVGLRKIPLGGPNEGYEVKLSSLKHIHVPKEEEWLEAEVKKGENGKE